MTMEPWSLFARKCKQSVTPKFTFEARPPAPFLEKEVLNFSSDSGCVL